MYVSTANMVKPNATARLISPIFKATNYKGCEMRFHYHMFGNGKDVLNVKIRTSGDMKSPLKTVWTRYGKSIDLVDWDFFQKEIVPPKFEDINFCEVNPRSLIPI